MDLSVDKQTEALIAMLEDVEAYINELITTAMKKDPKQLSLLYWRKRAALVHRELQRLHGVLHGTVQKVIAANYDFGQAIVEAATGAKLSEVGGTFGVGYNERAIQMLANGLNQHVDVALTTVGRRVDDSFRRAGLRAAAFHAMSGTDVRRARMQMEAMLRKDGVTAFVDAAHRQWTLQSYTAMVIRTTTRESVTQGTYAGMMQTGHELVQVSHHINSCKECLPFDGKTFSLPKASVELRQQFPVLKQLPPFHPNCKHVIAPSTLEFDLLESKLHDMAVAA